MTPTPSSAASSTWRSEMGAEVVVPIAGGAHPSGYVEKAAYEDMAEAIVGAVRGGCDAAFLALHGAMVCEHVDDGEGELLRRIRAVAPHAADRGGPRLPRAHDRGHGRQRHRHRRLLHLSPRRHGRRPRSAPRGRSGARCAGEVAPVMVWGSRPMMTSTLVHTPSRQPMKDIMDMAMAAEASGRRAERLRVRRLPPRRHPAHLVLRGDRLRPPHRRGPGAPRPPPRHGVGPSRRLPVPRRPARLAGRARADRSATGPSSSSTTATTPPPAARRT